jgi:DNA-binding transcriptional LysR family regulator
LPEPWERLESWVLFTERFELAVPKGHSLAMRNSLLLSQLGQIRLLPRSYCEQWPKLSGILAAHGLALDFQDCIASEHDLMALLSANVGVSFAPQTTLTTEGLRLVHVQDLELTRPVVLYAVAGRQRSAAATGLQRLLRSANWPAACGRTGDPASISPGPV